MSNLVDGDLESIARIIDRALYRHPSEMFPSSSERSDRPFDYERIARILAAFDAARFFETNFPLAHNLVGKEPLLRHACEQVAFPGVVAEFGVMEGRTLRILCEMFPDQDVFGFDSFEGLPEDWRHDRRKGIFSSEGKVPENLPSNARIRKGMFSDTIPVFASQTLPPISLLHIDCDLYSSARMVLFGLAKSIRSGTIIVFDEYINYPGWREHEHRAFTEFCNEFGVAFTYVAFASSYLSVAVRIENIEISEKDNP
ncbi:class I SAM-dependent methyltransferase [Rhizobium laguerreae]|uniref:TylF/MycF/NovP-related O-methyltransferase n=1 Tax=Rhizobium laguerreae TaxID=1076926 RepID=UPI001C8FB989|nr:class I SAM-dependent methyltransferase [Rhizobium laguerreae]MBY3425462.1 class I SAM-dependent methyltransferase [Rhizobium laguerreae]